MTAEDFLCWLADMKMAGIARTDAECARMLGKTDDTIIAYKRKGTDLTVALACRALLIGAKPYP